MLERGRGRGRGNFEREGLRVAKHFLLFGLLDVIGLHSEEPFVFPNIL